MKSVCKQRRRFVGICLASASGLMLPSLQAQGKTGADRELSFYNTHTGERLRRVYWSDGDFIADSLADINHLLRDHRTGDIKSMDPRLLDLLYNLQFTLDHSKPFHVISGYRSPKTNKMLSGKSSGVAKRSMHMLGKAIDIRVPGVDSNIVRKAALSLKGGGVGYYSRSNFVHLDIGRVRTW